MDKLKKGGCAYCDVPIRNLQEGCRLPNYREIWLLISNGSKMRVAVCEECKKKLNKKMSKKIMAKHRNFWKNSIRKTRNINKIKKNIDELKIKGFARKEKLLAFHHSIVKSFSFSPTTVIRSGEVNQDFDDVITSLRANHHEDADGTKVLPVGLICMWHGTIASIPSSWALCDGTNSTPDLRAKFVRGAPAATNPGTTGGADTHTLTTNELAAHAHDLKNVWAGTAGDASWKSRGIQNANLSNDPTVDDDTQNAGGGAAHNNMPAYYEVAFIMYTG